MNNLRKYIRQTLQEAIVEDHFMDRIKERLLSGKPFQVGYESTPANYYSVGTYNIPQAVIVDVLEKIELLKQVKFPRNKDYGIKVAQIVIQPNLIQFFEGESLQTIKGKNLVLIPGGDESNGNIYYAVVRADALKTFMLMKNYVTIDAMKLRVDHILTDWNRIKSNQVR